jgi:putative membrane protein
MKRRTFLWSSALGVIGSSLAVAKDDQRIGKLGPAEFKQANDLAGAKVKAITPSDAPLTEVDRQLVAKVAMAGLFQLSASTWALSKIQSTDIKAIAQAEIDEQTVLSDKLKELAAAKSFDLPKEPGGEQKKILNDLMEATEPVDREYLKTIGVDGHQAIQTVMEEVRAKAQDATLKQLAATALPIIGVHLTVARDELEAL